MTTVVGCAPDGGSLAAVHLGGLIARSADADLVIAAVVPTPWAPSLARVDGEYRQQLERDAQSALDRAREAMPAKIEARYVVHAARSAPAGLLELAEQHRASAVVVGSSRAGALGHVTLGSVTDRVVHSSQVPVALAPRGFRAKPSSRVTRVTAAYGGSSAAADLVVGAAGVAAEVGAELRLASFAVRPRSAITAGIGSRGEEPVLAAWVETVRRYTDDVLAEVRALPHAPAITESVVGYGEAWAEALDDVEWHSGDVLVVGSSDIGPLSRVFLGSNGTKIVRSSPVPAFVVPRGAAEELAERAEEG